MLKNIYRTPIKVVLVLKNILRFLDMIGLFSVSAGAYIKNIITHIIPIIIFINIVSNSPTLLVCFNSINKGTLPSTKSRTSLSRGICIIF